MLAAETAAKSGIMRNAAVAQARWPKSSKMIRPMPRIRFWEYSSRNLRELRPPVQPTALTGNWTSTRTEQSFASRSTLEPTLHVYRKRCTSNWDRLSYSSIPRARSPEVETRRYALSGISKPRYVSTADRRAKTCT